MKYKVGDIIKIRTRESMENEFGLDEEGYISAGRRFFNEEMKKYCGEYVTIYAISCGGYDIREGGYIIKDRMIDEEEKFKEGDIVYVNNSSEDKCLEDKVEVIYLSKIKDFFLCVGCGCEKRYNSGESFSVATRKYAVKKPIEEEKKERKVIMTDREREEFKKKNGIKE